jgi:hypothetical protein
MVRCGFSHSQSTTEKSLMNLPLDPVFYNTLLAFAPCVTAPSFTNLVIVCCGWLQCTRRRTITGMIEAAGVIPDAHHERFHRLFSQGRFVPDQLGQIAVRLWVQALVPQAAPILLAGDDTLFKKSGHKIFGASYFRDAVLSSRTRVVTRWGLNFVVLGLVVRHPLWPGRDLCLPVLARLHQGATKSGKSSPELMAEMIGLVAQWLPQRTVHVAVDGAYANLSVFSNLPHNVVLLSRTRTDAALYELPPEVTGKRRAGRPRTKGARLPQPRTLASQAQRVWHLVQVELYGETQQLEVSTFVGLWYHVAKAQPLRFVLVRKVKEVKSKKHKDGHDWICLCCSDVQVAVEDILRGYGGRWSIEVAFHEAKEHLGIQEPQSRLESAVQTLYPLGLLLVGLVKYWYVSYGHDTRYARLARGRWNRHKSQPAFSDMLAAVRRAGWAQRFMANSASPTELQNMVQVLTDRLAQAA